MFDWRGRESGTGRGSRRGKCEVRRRVRRRTEASENGATGDRRRNNAIQSEDDRAPGDTRRRSGATGDERDTRVIPPERSAGAYESGAGYRQPYKTQIRYPGTGRRRRNCGTNRRTRRREPGRGRQTRSARMARLIPHPSEGSPPGAPRRTSGGGERTQRKKPPQKQWLLTRVHRRQWQPPAGLSRHGLAGA